MQYKIEAAVCSNMGKVRKNNEDNFYFDGKYMNESQRNAGSLLTKESDEDLQIYAVCDGMGGEEAGEEASISAVRGLYQYARSNYNWDDEGQIKSALQKISDSIEDAAKSKGYHSGTTIAMVILHHNKAKTVHVGDSRVYCYENNKLSRLTVDHSEVQRMLSMGLISESELDTHPKRHVISQFLGMPRDDALLSPSISNEIALKENKRFLICSDGLTDMVKDPQISEILSAEKNVQDAANQLIEAALHNGGKDNVTVICLDVKGAKENGKSQKNGRKNGLLSGKRKMRLSVGGMIVSLILILFTAAMFLKDFIL